MTLISDRHALERILDAARDSGVLCLDTEFVREGRYWPLLCLVQFAVPGAKSVVLDPLAADADLSPLWDILADPAVVKVMHAARQDCEIFRLQGDVSPEPLFDTQIAASLCGLGEQPAMATLLGRLLDVGLDKSARVTNWHRRPLSPAQLAYALADVAHLHDLYLRLTDELHSLGRMALFAEAQASQQQQIRQAGSSDDVWQRLVRKARNCTPAYCGVLRALCLWRESTARARDLPRNRILSDHQLQILAAEAPATTADLARVRGMSAGLVRRFAAGLLEAIAEGQRSPVEPGTAPAVRESEKKQMVLLRLLLHMAAGNANMSPGTIAGSDDLLALVRRQAGPLTTGWRAEVFGNQARDLLCGRLAIGCTRDGVCVHLLTPERGTSSGRDCDPP